MEPTQPGFSLNQEISDWQKNMLNGALTPDDVTELTQHLQDELITLQHSGLNEQEAWLIARQRIGSPVVINEEFHKVNPDFVASRNWLMLFWGATLFMILQTLVFIAPITLRYIMLGRPNKFEPIMTSKGLNMTVDSMCIALLALLVLNITMSNKMSVWFNKILTGYSTIISILMIIIGSWLALFNFALVIERMISIKGKNWPITDEVSMLGFIFYGSLIFSTAYFTIRYRKQEIRSFKIFNSNINWPVTFIMGLLFQLVCQFTYMLHSDPLSIVIVAGLFGLLGWMIGYSKTPIANFISAQLAPLVIFICGLYINPDSWVFFFMIYVAAVAALLVGCFISRRNNYQLQAAD